ncbi:MAG TPA: hypothetical protein VHK63_01115 [Candidatus Limnocylindria bacterium]|nr:hypothetical protein [Candidatus Limnocylindria bacterium]
MRRRSRLAVAALLLLAALSASGLVAFAAASCAMDLPGRPCPEAGFNRAVVVALIGMSTALAVAPFAFLAEVAVRRRIEYRGSWGRAMRRGLLAGLALAALAGLRVGGALTVPSALFVLAMALVAEWFAVRRFDLA